MAHELSQESETFLEREVSLGIYPSRTDALEAGVELLRRRRVLIDRLDESRRQLDAGEFTEFDEDGLRQFFQQLIAQS
ncbi:MAG: hypothetical protein IT425_08420 [Pirellulales bacterium]|nr:hypothetical protein [Pirellulales bacterium]